MGPPTCVQSCRPSIQPVLVPPACAHQACVGSASNLPAWSSTRPCCLAVALQIRPRRAVSSERVATPRRARRLLPFACAPPTTPPTHSTPLSTVGPASSEHSPPHTQTQPRLPSPSRPPRLRGRPLAGSQGLRGPAARLRRGGGPGLRHTPAPREGLVGRPAAGPSHGVTGRRRRGSEGGAGERGRIIKLEKNGGPRYCPWTVVPRHPSGHVPDSDNGNAPVPPGLLSRLANAAMTMTGMSDVSDGNVRVSGQLLRQVRGEVSTGLFPA
jgi:hypothetical protein